jgi:hypothetical protein
VTHATKKRIVVSVLMLAALWPLAHRALAAHYRINPWKLGAWAMYTTATPPVVVVPFAKRSRGLAVIDVRTLPAAVRASYDDFRISRHALGRLRRPDELGRAILRAREDVDTVVVAVQTTTLDAETGLMRGDKDLYEYSRKR